jgi:hypothetical protein
MNVRVNSKSRKDLAALLAAEGSPTACVMVHKVGPRADSKRTPDGGTSWSIDRPDIPWAASIVSGEGLTSSDITIVEGVRFWFAVLDPKQIPPLEVGVLDGQPYVRPAT